LEVPLYSLPGEEISKQKKLCFESEKSKELLLARKNRKFLANPLPINKVINILITACSN
jgi:hypothetical protein